MTQFMTLEEFMTFDKDHFCNYYKTGEQWLCWYAIAKQSFELFGEHGPEKGSNVYTLVNGHRGNGFDFRIFNGSLDETYFGLSVPRDFSGSRAETCFNLSEDYVSLVEKTKWWKCIVSVNMNMEVPSFVRTRPHRTNVELMTEFIVRG